MNSKIKTIKLTQSDKRIISNHSNICTDSHGKGCELKRDNDKNKGLN